MWCRATKTQPKQTGHKPKHGGREKTLKEEVLMDLPSSSIQWAELGTAFCPDSEKITSRKSKGKTSAELTEPVSLLSLFHFQLNGLPLTSQLVYCQLTALTKKDLLNTDSFHLH